MTVLDKIQRQFGEYTEQHFVAAEILPCAVAHASEALGEALLAERKVISCGNAGAGLLAQYFAAEMLNRFDKERPGLPAIALTHDAATLMSIAHTWDYSQIFAKQIRSLGKSGDVLLIVTTQDADNLKQAIEAAHERSMRIICLAAQYNNSLIALLDPKDIAIVVPTETATVALELFLQAIHALFTALDYHLFGVDE